MRTIAYLSQILITDDDVARLVVEYARMLAVNDTADTVSIPVTDGSGSVSQVELLLGPASQMLSAESGTPYVDVNPEAAVEMLRQKIEGQHLRAVPSEPDGWVDPGFEA